MDKGASTTRLRLGVNLAKSHEAPRDAIVGTLTTLLKHQRAEMQKHSHASVPRTLPVTNGP